jgi:hypothetical protein
VTHVRVTGIQIHVHVPDVHVRVRAVDIDVGIEEAEDLEDHLDADQRASQDRANPIDRLLHRIPPDKEPPPKGQLS